MTKPTSKVIQISTSTIINNINDYIIITTALCEDGTIWRKDSFCSSSSADWEYILEANND
tara:strand:+ start:1544 stop:1723 length:180 start_codon:yes stop_codon:yes gene_type:complete